MGFRLVKRAFVLLHRFALRLRVIITPLHYYVPYSSVLELERTRALWAKPSELVGLEVDIEAQAETLRKFCLPFQQEFVGTDLNKEGISAGYGLGYGRIEAMALHAVVRKLGPRRVVEVGSGVSTYCMLRAVEVGRSPSEITCIEPFPSSALLEESRVKVLNVRVQEVDLRIFEDLEAGDLLFIDSSHTVKVGGDVNFIVLEILPRLQSGVVVHFHDIYMPYDYPRDVLDNPLRQWMETSLVRAYLTFNERCEILFSMSLLHYKRPELLQEVFPDYRPATDVDGLEVDWRRNIDDSHFPSSLYLRTLV